MRCEIRSKTKDKLVEGKLYFKITYELGMMYFFTFIQASGGFG